MYRIIASLFATMILSAILTPFIRLLAFKVGAVDNPNARRVNKVPMPTMGGLAIFLAFNVTTFIEKAIPNRTIVGIIVSRMYNFSYWNNR